MNENDRRSFLLPSRDMVVGALTAGTLVACASAGPTVVAAQTSSSPSTAAFGWEIVNLSNNGADAYFSVQRERGGPLSRQRPLVDPPALLRGTRRDREAISPLNTLAS
jgi:hypothetical protein